MPDSFVHLCRLLRGLPYLASVGSSRLGSCGRREWTGQAGLDRTGAQTRDPNSAKNTKTHEHNMKSMKKHEDTQRTFLVHLFVFFCSLETFGVTWGPIGPYLAL